MPPVFLYAVTKIFDQRNVYSGRPAHHGCGSVFGVCQVAGFSIV